MSDLAALYSKQHRHLWVEDLLTRDYLNALWAAPDLKLWIGAGGGLREIVEASRQELPELKIFWMNDGDWNPRITPTTAGLQHKLPRHEIENYLLDHDALASSPRLRSLKRGLAAPAIQGQFHAQAHRLISVVACARVLHALKVEIELASWPRDPTTGTCPDDTSAQRWLQSQLAERRSSLRSARSALDTSLQPAQIAGRFDAALAAARDEVDSGAWLLSFPGKELLRGVWSELFEVPRTGAAESDIARHVAHYQRAQQRVPTELTTLLVAMRAA